MKGSTVQGSSEFRGHVSTADCARGKGRDSHRGCCRTVREGGQEGGGPQPADRQTAQVEAGDIEPGVFGEHSIFGEWKEYRLLNGQLTRKRMEHFGAFFNYCPRAEGNRLVYVIFPDPRQKQSSA